MERIIDSRLREILREGGSKMVDNVGKYAIEGINLGEHSIKTDLMNIEINLKNR